MKPLSERFSEIIGIVNVGRGDEDRDVWHEVAALEARIRALEDLKGLVIPKGEWSICAAHNRAYWTDEGCFPCRIEALEKLAWAVRMCLADFEDNDSPTLSVAAVQAIRSVAAPAKETP